MNPQNRLYLAQMVAKATVLGLKLTTHNPGDGLRIRVFKAGDPSDYFGPSNPITTLFAGTRKNRETIAHASAWLKGFEEGTRHGQARP